MSARSTNDHSPTQTAPEPVLLKTYPVLQMHFTTLVVASCVQLAFESHPPLLTRQLSVISRKARIFLVRCHSKPTGQDEHTCACHNGIRTSIGVTSFAGANDCIAAGIMRADGIRITSTVVHLTSIYKQPRVLCNRSIAHN